MKTTAKKIATVAIVGAISAFCLSACSQEQPSGSSEPAINMSDTSGGVAVVVNGEEIGENAVSEYIALFRANNSLEDDEAFGQYMGTNDYTPEKLRELIIEDYINQALIRQIAAEKGIEVTDAEVDKAIENVKKQLGNESTWRIMLKQYGMNEQQYRDQMRLSLLRQKIMNDITGASQLDSLYTQFTSALRQNGGDELANLMDEIASKMDEASGTDKVKADDETVLAIIKLSEEDYKDAQSLDDIPAELVSAYRTSATSQMQQLAYEQFMNKYREDADITINEMPENLPYMVEVITVDTQSAPEDEQAPSEASGESAEPEAQATEQPAE